MPWEPYIQGDCKIPNSDAYVNTYLEQQQTLGVGPAVLVCGGRGGLLSAYAT